MVGCDSTAVGKGFIETVDELLERINGVDFRVQLTMFGSESPFRVLLYAT